MELNLKELINFTLQEFVEYSKLSFEYITYNRNGEQVAVQII